MQEEDVHRTLINDSPPIQTYRATTSSQQIVIETIVSPQNSLDHLCRLKNEYNILSRNLPNCGASVRKALSFNEDDDIAELSLEWAEGITLREWIRNNPFSPSSPLTKEQLILRVRVAKGLTSALLEVHKAQIAHNDVTEDNFIINEKKTNNSLYNSEHQPKDELNEQCTVKIIGFGYATPLWEVEADDEGKRVNDDIPCLGNVLNNLFAPSSQSKSAFVGAPSVMDDDGRRGGFLPPSIDTIIPKSISILLSNFCVNKFHSQTYMSVEQIKDDLNQMLQHPEIFLFDLPDGQPPDQLYYLSSQNQPMIFGRSKEISVLLDAFKNLTRYDGSEEKQCKAVLVCGRSGTGKSILTQQLHKPVSDAGGYFLCGKYEKLRSLHPYSALIVAFTKFCDMIVSRGKTTVQNMAAKIKSAVGSKAKLLTDMIPNLENIIGKQTNSLEELSGIEAQNRFNFMFRNFVRAISSPDHPIILSLDDLQWADASSMELVKLLTFDTENMCFLFVGTYRDNEIRDAPPDHPIAMVLKEIEEGKPTMKVTKMEIGDLDIDEVNLMVSHSLRMVRRLTRSLAGVVHEKTNGNAFFTREFVESLIDGGLLRYSFDDMCWVWDIKELRMMEVSDNVVEMMSGKMKKLCATTQHVLRMSAVLGSSFEGKILEHIEKRRSKDLQGEKLTNGDGSLVEGTVMAEMDKLGHLGFIISPSNTDKPRSYKFAHDKIQQAAYSLIPSESREKIHLFVGRAINTSICAEEELERRIFSIVDHMNIGASCLVSEDERVELAKLNLKAGKVGMRSSACISAASYLKAGINLLNHQRCWEEQYDLSLELYSLLGEAQLANGVTKEIEIATEKVIANGKSLLDKIPAYKSLIRCQHAVQGDADRSISTCLDVLSQLGVKCPRTVTTRVLIMELIKTKMMLRGKSNEMLLDLPLATDDRAIVVMQILLLLGTSCYLANPKLVPLSVMKGLRMTLRFGLFKESPLFFNSFGLILCAVSGDFRQGYRFGQLALSNTSRLISQDIFPRVELAVAMFVSHWKEDIRSVTTRILCIHKLSMGLGDHDTAMNCLSVFTIYSLNIGCPLHLLEEETVAFAKQMVEYNNYVTHLAMCAHRQFMHNLLGFSDDPTVLTGDVMNQEEMIKKAVAHSNTLFFLIIHIFRLTLAYLFHDYPLAVEMAEKTRNISREAPGIYVVVSQVFYSGLTALAVAKESGRSLKWAGMARRCIKQMKIWSDESPKSCRHRYLLLKAEKIALSTRNEERVKGAYDAAIEAARNVGFVHDEALGNERAGIFFRKVGNPLVSNSFMSRASELYKKWGAKAKVDRMQSIEKNVEHSKPRQILHHG